MTIDSSGERAGRHLSSLASSLSRRSVLKTGAAAAAGLALTDAALSPATASGVRALQDQVPTGGTLTMAYAADPSTLDPHVNSVTNDSLHLHAIFDCLIERATDGTLYPGLATEWSVAEDNVTWTLKLRDGVVFHDGTPFDAEAVVYNFDRMVDPATKSEYAVFQLGPYESSKAIDASTVEVTMKQPYGAFPASLATFGMGMVSPTAAKAAGASFGQSPVGTGPFKFVEWVPQDHVTFERNPDYNWASEINHVTGPAPLDQIVIRTIAEPATRAAALMSGEIDLANLNASDYVTLDGNSDYGQQTIAGEGYPPPGIFINTQKAPTDDVKVRQAIAFGIDKDEVNAVMYEGLADPADQVVSTFSWAYDPANALYSFDVDKANALLDEAGWVKGDGDYRSKDGTELKIVYLSLTTVQQIAELAQAQLKNIGINVELLVEDNPAQQQDAQQGNHNLVWTQWGGVDPGDLRKVYGSENIGTGWNFAHYNNPDLDAAFDDGQALNDQEQRKPIYIGIVKTLMDDATFVPLNNRTVFLGMKSNVKGSDVVDERGANPRLYNIYLES
jgi:peptide/nickel transport system substrate-binding protein